MALPMLSVPPSEPRSFIVPLVPLGVAGFQRNACDVASPVRSASPVTWPVALRLYPWLLVPPSVPRLYMAPVAPPGVAGFQRNAWSAALPVVADSPVTWPLALRALPKLWEPPSVPRWVFVPLAPLALAGFQRKVWKSASPSMYEAPET